MIYCSTEQKKKPPPPPESDSEEEIEVTKFTDPNTDIEYYKDQNNKLYDPNTQDEIGIWNEKTQSIDLLDLE